jgi:hypothetical protein
VRYVKPSIPAHGEPAVPHVPSSVLSHALQPVVIGSAFHVKVRGSRALVGFFLSCLALSVPVA